MTISTALTTSGYAFTPWADSALSQEARFLRQRIAAASEFRGSIAVGEPKRNAQEALDAAFRVAQVDDWDGAGAARVEPNTYVYASQFLRLLPAAIPVADIAADVDGEILFEWDLGQRRVFTVSVGRDGTLTYAGLFGHAKSHGTENLVETLPPVISDCLWRLIASAAT